MGEDAITRIQDILFDWPFWVSGLAVVAIMTTIKKSISAFGEELLKKPGVKCALQIGNIVFGGLLGLIPGFLPGETIIEQVLCGLVVGFLSEWYYRALKKVLPKGLQKSLGFSNSE